MSCLSILIFDCREEDDQFLFDEMTERRMEDKRGERKVLPLKFSGLNRSEPVSETT